MDFSNARKVLRWVLHLHMQSIAHPDGKLGSQTVFLLVQQRHLIRGGEESALRGIRAGYMGCI